MENNSDSSWRELQTVTTTTNIIKFLAELDGAGVTELTEHIDSPKSSIHAHLSTLRKAGFVIKDDDEYQLSYQFLLLGEYVRNDNLLYQFGRQRANQLAQETGHYAHLFVEKDGLGINIYESRGQDAEDYKYQSQKLQKREPLHVTACGKAILAHLPEDEVKEIIKAHGLVQMTENTITDKKTLLDELETIRNTGYAVNDEEEVEGFSAVAAPICVRGSEVIGSISVSGPTPFFNKKLTKNNIAEDIMDAASMIEVEINMSEQEL